MNLIVQVVFFGLVLIGIGVIVRTKNVIHAAYSLALVLVGLAGIYVLLNTELLAVVQLLLYAGGVAVLLVFGVMMTNRDHGELITKSRNSVLAAILALAIFSGLTYLITDSRIDEKPNVGSGNQVEQIGISFLTEHIVAFELIAFILLVALAGASYLAKMSADE